MVLLMFILFIDTNSFGAFAGDNSVSRGAPRGGSSSRGNRGVSDRNCQVDFLGI
jgi:hypothetical protein